MDVNCFETLKDDIEDFLNELHHVKKVTFKDENEDNSKQGKRSRKVDSKVGSEKIDGKNIMLMVDGQLKRTCDICIKNGKNSRLKLYQVNFDEAFYMCENVDCSYPLDVEGSLLSSVVKRDFQSISTASQRRLTATTQQSHLSPAVSISRKKTRSAVPVIPTVSDNLKLNCGSTNLNIPQQTKTLKYPLKENPVNVVQNLPQLNHFKPFNLASLNKQSSGVNNFNGLSKFVSNKKQISSISSQFELTASGLVCEKNIRNNLVKDNNNLGIQKVPSCGSLNLTIRDNLLKTTKVQNKRRTRSETPDSTTSSESSGSKRRRINDIFKEALKTKHIPPNSNRSSPLQSFLKKKVTEQVSPTLKPVTLPVQSKSKLTTSQQLVHQLLQDAKQKTPPAAPTLGAAKFAPFSLSKPTKSILKKDTETSKPVQSHFLKSLAKRLGDKNPASQIKQIIVKSVSNIKNQNDTNQIQKRDTFTSATSQAKLKNIANTEKPKPLQKLSVKNTVVFDDYCDSFDITVFDDLLDQDKLPQDHCSSFEKLESKTVKDWDKNSDGQSVPSSVTSSPNFSPKLPVYDLKTCSSAVDLDSLVPESQDQALDEEVSQIFSSKVKHSLQKSVGNCVQQSLVNHLKSRCDSNYFQALRKSPVEFDKLSGKLNASLTLSASGNTNDLILITDSVDNLVSSEIICEVIETRH